MFILIQEKIYRSRTIRFKEKEMKLVRETRKRRRKRDQELTLELQWVEGSEQFLWIYQNRKDTKEEEVEEGVNSKVKTNSQELEKIWELFCIFFFLFVLVNLVAINVSPKKRVEPGVISGGGGKSFHNLEHVRARSSSTSAWPFMIYFWMRCGCPVTVKKLGRDAAVAWFHKIKGITNSYMRSALL